MSTFDLSKYIPKDKEIKEWVRDTSISRYINAVLPPIQPRYSYTTFPCNRVEIAKRDAERERLRLFLLGNDYTEENKEFRTLIDSLTIDSSSWTGG
jgi:hypothetical protein